MKINTDSLIIVALDMNLMVDLKSNRYDSSLTVGGQIWEIDGKFNPNRIKNLLNVVGKINVSPVRKITGYV